MLQKKLLAGLLLAILLSIPVINATITAYVPVTLTNQQTANSVAGLQVIVSFNAMNAVISPYEASDLGNIRFYQTNAPATPANALYSWCEQGCTSSSTNAVFWVALTNAIGNVLTTSNTLKLNMTFTSGQARLNSTAIPYSTNLVEDDGSSISMTTIGGHPNYWMCSDAESTTGINLNPNYNQQAQDNYDGVTEVGNNTANTCTTFDNGQYVGAMIGVNAIDGISPSALSFYYGDTGDSKLLSFTTTTNSFAVIMVMCGQGGGCTAASGGSISGIPSQCNSQSTNSITTPDDGASASLYVCNTLPAGPYTITPNTGGADYTEGAWVFNESAPKSVFWVKLTNSIGNVLTTGNALTLNMIFLPTSTEYDGNVAGEAPQYTVPYANYDNGNNVFNYYINANSVPVSANTVFEWGTDGGDSTFAENSLADLVKSYVGGQNALMVNSLQQPHVGSGGGDEYLYFMPSNNLPQSFVETIWSWTSNSVASGGTSSDVGMAGNALNNYPGYWEISGDNGDNQQSLYWDVKGNTIGTRKSITIGGPANAFPCRGIWCTAGLEYNSTSTTFTAFYSNSFGLEVNDIYYSVSNTLTTTFNSYVVWGGYVYPANIPNNKYYGLVTVRNYPPNGIQPGVIFGNFTSGQTTSTTTTVPQTPFTGGLPPSATTSSPSTTTAHTTSISTVSTTTTIPRAINATYPTTSIMGGASANSMQHPTTSTSTATTYQTTITASTTTTPTPSQQTASGNPITNFFRSLTLWLESLFGGRAQ